MLVIMEVSLLRIKCSNQVFSVLLFFKDAAGYVKSCDQWQRIGTILNDIRCHCTTSWRSKYLMSRGLISWDYFHHQMVISISLCAWIMCQSGLRQWLFLQMMPKLCWSFWEKKIFTRFRTPREIISDGGKHFLNQLAKNILAKYGVYHKVALFFHP